MDVDSNILVAASIKLRLLDVDRATRSKIYGRLRAVHEVQRGVPDGVESIYLETPTDAGNVLCGVFYDIDAASAPPGQQRRVITYYVPAESQPLRIIVLSDVAVDWNRRISPDDLTDARRRRDIAAADGHRDDNLP